MLEAKVVRESEEFVKHDLVVGKSYEVERISMGGFYTNVYLVDIPGCFNSVIFDFYENGEEIDIYRDSRFNPYL